MAKYYNAGSINLSGSWGTIDATTYNDSEATTTALTTSYQISSGATPGAITISHIGIKLSVRTGTTGTMTVMLRNITDSTDVTGTDVAINTADLPVAATADVNGGWHFFKLASPVTLTAGKSYGVQAKTSSSSQISLFSTATTNWARALVTTTTATPGAGDDMIVAGEYTGAGTSNSFTVTWDNTASTDYGSAPTAANSLLSPGIAVCNKGTLLSGTTAATAYVMNMSNSIVVYSGGVLSFGTTGTPIPRGGSFTLTFDCGANVDYGLVIRNLGTSNMQGLSRTVSKEIDRCFLNTDEAASQTTLGVDTDTGWLSGDVIGIASTSRTSTQCEQRILSGDAGASSVVVTVGLTNAHSGTSPTQAEVILLTRNVKIQGASSSLQAYVSVAATAILDWDWAEFNNMGSATAGKLGIGLACTTGSQVINRCSFHDFIVTGSTGMSVTASSGSGLSVTNSVFYNIHSTHLTVGTTSGTPVFSGNICMLNVSGTIMTLSDIGLTIAGLTVVGATTIGITPSQNSSLGSWSDFTVHSCTTIGISSGNFMTGSITGTNTTWRCGGVGVSLGSGDLTIENLTLFGNTISNMQLATGRFILNNFLSAGDTTFATTNGITLNTGGSAAIAVNLKISTGSFSPTSGIFVAHTTDFNNTSLVAYFRVRLDNVVMAGTNEIASQAAFSEDSIIGSERHDQTNGNHKTLVRYGTFQRETTTVHTGSQSIKMIPIHSSGKLEIFGLFGGFKVQVANGQTCTPSVYVYEDASYNGARARLIVKRNTSMGIANDTVLDTATASSDLAWEQLTGTTAAVTDDGTLEFVVDCDGTAGALFVDTFTATVA